MAILYSCKPQSRTRARAITNPTLTRTLLKYQQGRF